MLSDVTLQLGNSEEFEGHSVILKQNSKWFAKNYAGQSTMNIEDVARDLIHSVLDEKLDWKHDDSDSECACSTGLSVMLRFCYTAEYPFADEDLEVVGQAPDSRNLGSRCEMHLSMALLAIKFGIPNLVTYSVNRFSTAADRVREATGGQPRALAYIINKIYDIPETESHEELRTAARQQVLHVVMEATKEIFTLMPKAF